MRDPAEVAGAVVAAAVRAVALPVLLKYSDDQPRDDHGRWTGSGGGDATGKVYLRFGDWSPDESSTNWLRSDFHTQTFTPEGGVSVYELDKNGNPVDPGGNPDKPVAPSTNAFGLSNNDTGGMMRYRQGAAEQAFRNGVWESQVTLLVAVRMANHFSVTSVAWGTGFRTVIGSFPPPRPTL